eukprot:TRINITY_DN8127_c0_g1_i1.p2 TRINITY_DN8127_c0_g1~~TRINITY_DN8127_c0_g1_i1.p2  ORF type:complete len:169 (+),score=35.36 TRINITY_DN8127_c0_g1_i1:681-1187(+)
MEEGQVQIASHQATIQFGASPQQVQLSLGVPDSVCHKQSGTAVQEVPSDYFYNYFTLGIDLLFDGATHTVTKFVFHTNQPGHRDFNQYDKCHFSITLPDVTDSISSESTLGDAEALLGDPLGGRPVVNSAPSSSSPFGATKFYGFNHGLILEIMENGQIASASIYLTS